METDAELEWSGWEVFGHGFRDADLLRLAVTPRREVSWPNNDRLEFLGDSMLQAATALLAYQKAPHQKVGYLAAMAVQARTNEYLSYVCLAYDFDSWRRRVRPESTDLQTEKERADFIESLLGAIFLDGGWDALLLAVTNMIHENKPFPLHDSTSTAEDARPQDQLDSDEDQAAGVEGHDKATRLSRGVPFPTITEADIEPVQGRSTFEADPLCGSCKAALRGSTSGMKNSRARSSKHNYGRRSVKLSKRTAPKIPLKGRKRESRKNRFRSRNQSRSQRGRSIELKLRLPNEAPETQAPAADQQPSPPSLTTTANTEATLSAKAMKVAKWKEWRKQCRKSSKARRAKKRLENQRNAPSRHIAVSTMHTSEVLGCALVALAMNLVPSGKRR